MRTADNAGFKRNAYIEKKMPTNISDITVMLFFGDIRSSFIFSSIIFKRYREEIKGSKYFILCTWPGYEGLFPWADEVWTLKDDASLKSVYSDTNCFENYSEILLDCRRKLNWVFQEVVDYDVLRVYYDNGIQQEFWNTFKKVKRTLLNIPSSTILGQSFNQEIMARAGHKVFLWPALKIRSWMHGKLHYIKAPRDFWIGLVEGLIKENLVPVVYNNFYCHDISSDLSDKCIYFYDKDVMKVMSAMRAAGCVLDVFSGMDRWAMEARTPFISLDERSRYVCQKENEIDGLCCEEDLPRKYIFLFPTIIENGNRDGWNVNIYDPIMSKLRNFIPTLDRGNWPSITEKTDIVLYEKVSKKKMKKIGTRFIKINPD